MHYQLNDSFYFGKYKGETIKEIIKSDINYIVWCLIQIDDFKLSKESEQEFKKYKNNIAWNHTRLTDQKALSINLGFEQGDIESERNKNIEDILNKVGIKK